MDKGIIITIYRNLKPYEGKKVSISSTTSLKKLLNICSEILSFKSPINQFKSCFILRYFSQTDF